MVGQVISYKSFGDELFNVRNQDGERLLTKDDVKNILSRFSPPMMTEYASCFDSPLLFCEWTASLYLHNKGNITFPTLDDIAIYRSLLREPLCSLSLVSVVELMLFFTPTEANKYGTYNE